MAFNMDHVRGFIRQLSEKVEDLWIMRECIRSALLDRGLSLEELATIEQNALQDPGMRKRAQEQFRELRKFLESEALEAMFEDLSEGPPPSGKPN
jgi:hypothetical protein